MTRGVIEGLGKEDNRKVFFERRGHHWEAWPIANSEEDPNLPFVGRGASGIEAIEDLVEMLKGSWEGITEYKGQLSILMLKRYFALEDLNLDALEHFVGGSYG